MYIHMGKSRGWCFVINNYTADDIAQVHKLAKQVPYLVCGQEVGEEKGTLHLQGYCYFANPREMPNKTLKRASWHQQLGTFDQASYYCKKDDPDFFESGTPPEQGKRNDLKEVYDAVKSGTKTVSDIIEEHPEVYNRAFRALHALEDIGIQKRFNVRRTEPKECIWLYGEAGMLKSEFVFDKVGEDSLYLFPYDNNGWWDMYSGQNCIYFDDFRAQITFSDLLRLTDPRWNTFQARRRGRTPLPVMANRIFITSVPPPWEVYRNLSVNDSLAQLFRRMTVLNKTPNGLKEITFEMYREGL